MIIQAKFDKVRDFAPTTPGLAMDMATAMDSGVVFDTGTLGDSNELDDPTSIRCRVNNAFEAVDSQRRMFTIAASKQASKVEAGSSAVNPEKGASE